MMGFSLSIVVLNPFIFFFESVEIASIEVVLDFRNNGSCSLSDIFPVEVSEKRVHFDLLYCESLLFVVHHS